MLLHRHLVSLKEESVYEHGQSLVLLSYQIHSILLLLIIRHPNLVSLPRQVPLEESVKIHIISLVVGQLVNEA